MKTQAIRFVRMTGALLLPLFLLIFIVLQAYGASGDQLWVRRYNGPANRSDFASAIAVDTSGNVYVTGQSEGSGTQEDYATIKYDSAGNTKWVRRYNGPGNDWEEATAIALDTSGSVYVTGSSTGSGTSYDYATIKYSPAGRRKWVRRYNYRRANKEDVAYAIAVDASDNVYVTGFSLGSGTFTDYATMKYDSAGRRRWVRRYNGPIDGDDEATAIAVDTSGNVYVTGFSQGSGTYDDYTTVKYDSAGNRKWVRRYNGPVGEDRAYAIALDTSGNVYVTGLSYNSNTSSYDYATIKYDSAGRRKWVRRYRAGAKDFFYVNTLAVDTSGNVYVTGSSYRSRTDYDYATVKYGPDGNRKWVRRYNYWRGNGDDEAHAIAVDTSGNVYVTGRSWGSATSDDYATIKYDSAGNKKWVRRYNGPLNWSDGATAIAVDTSGNVFVAGHGARCGTGYDYATIKYAP